MGSPDFFNEQVYHDCVHADHTGRFDDPTQIAQWSHEFGGLTRAQMRDVLIEHGTPEKQAKMRVGQIWQWVYEKGVRDFGVMSNLAKTYRSELAEHFVIEVPEVVSKQISLDGTRKYLMRIAGRARG